MELLFLRQTALDTIRNDISDNLDYYAKSEPWLDEYFLHKDISNYSFSSGIEIEEFSLVPGNADTDSENAVRLFESLKGKLNRLQATDFRLWTYLTHVYCWDYIKTRWNLDEGERKSWVNRINDRYCISSRSPYMRNGISRLYWSAELTYDEKNENPYEYLEFVFKWQDLAVNALDRQIGRAKDSLLGNLQALKEAELNEDDRRLFFTKINQYGGVKLLDTLSREQSLDVSRQYIEYILSLPIVENGKTVLVKNTENGNTMRYGVENGKLVLGRTEFRTTDRLLRRRQGSVIEINNAKWQIVEIA